METKCDESLEYKYPSVELAYPIAVSSYETAIKRYDTVDGKIQTILAFVAVVSIAVPSIANSRGISFYSFWFFLALIFFVSIVAIGIYARLTGVMRVVSPDMLFDNWLHKPTWEFKKDFIAFAGDDFKHNLKIIEFKWRLTVILTVIFFFQVTCLMVWVLGAVL